MLQNQLVEVAERLASALLLLAPRHDTPDMILVNARICRNQSLFKPLSSVVLSAKICPICPMVLQFVPTCLLPGKQRVVIIFHQMNHLFCLRKPGVATISYRTNQQFHF